MLVIAASASAGVKGIYHDFGHFELSELHVDGCIWLAVYTVDELTLI